MKDKMRFSIIFKAPDALEHAIPHPDDCPINNDVQSEPSQEQLEEMKRVFNQFVRYGETVVIRFDTEKGTATVKAKLMKKKPVYSLKPREQFRADDGTLWTIAAIIPPPNWTGNLHIGETVKAFEIVAYKPSSSNKKINRRFFHQGSKFVEVK